MAHIVLELDPDLAAAVDALIAAHPNPYETKAADLAKAAIMAAADLVRDDGMVISKAAYVETLANYACRILSLKTGSRWVWETLGDSPESEVRYIDTKQPFGEEETLH